MTILNIPLLPDGGLVCAVQIAGGLWGELGFNTTILDNFKYLDEYPRLSDFEMVCSARSSFM